MAYVVESIVIAGVIAWFAREMSRQISYRAVFIQRVRKTAA